LILGNLNFIEKYMYTKLSANWMIFQITI